MTSWSPASHPGLVSMALLSADGSSHICHRIASMSNVKPTCLSGTYLPAMSPRLCPRSFTFRRVHHSSQYPRLLLYPKPSPLRRWHSTLPFLPPTKFDSSIDYLQNALNQISSANLLTLNSSKTEFLLIRLSKQFAKINNFSLNTPHSALKSRLHIR